MSESATLEISEELKEIGDKIANLTLKQAKELSDYIKDEYGIEPAAGGGVVMAAAPTDGGAVRYSQGEADSQGHGQEGGQGKGQGQGHGAARPGVAVRAGDEVGGEKSEGNEVGG